MKTNNLLKSLVENFALETKENERVYYKLNRELKLDFSDEKEAARFLVEVIYFWKGKFSIFCNSHTEGNEKDWNFNYKIPSSCGSCERAQEIISKIFGNCRNFNVLPFISSGGDRTYVVSFAKLKDFAKSSESVKDYIKNTKQREAKEMAEREAKMKFREIKRQCADFSKKFGKIKINKDLKQQILEYVNEKSLTIVNPEVAVVKDERSEYGSSGGIGYYSQVRVFYGNQSRMKEWQWRDRYSASNDKPQNSIQSLGEIKVTSEKDEITVVVELINKDYPTRKASFNFTKQKAEDVKKISAEEQPTFKLEVEEEKEKIMTELNRLWQLKPKMYASYPSGMTMPMGTPSEVSYRKPMLLEEKVLAKIGVAAFVIEEQIDHKCSQKQMRHNLYVIKFGGKTELVAEDHAHDSEGGAFLKILELNNDNIVINTKDGKKTISI